MTPAARRLTEAHRLAQAELGAVAVVQMHATWPLLDPNDLDGSFQRWLLATLPTIQNQRAASARLAANYLTVFKTLELGIGARLVPVLDEQLNRRAVTTSLLVTGPLSIKRAMSRGVSLERALDVAQAASAAAGMRHALGGGRDTTARTLHADQDAHGYARVASGNACNYCSGLEGITFATDDVFEAHDGCMCSSAPVFA